MPVQSARATAVALPAQSGVANAYPSVHLADAFAIGLPIGSTTNPEVLARFILAHQPAWIGFLIRVRDLIVAVFGLKTATGLATLSQDGRAGRVGIFKIYSSTGQELVAGEDDKHLDFRVSFLCSSASGADPGARLTVATVVHCHNLLGRTYLFVIAPFHRMVVKASLGRAARVGWPRA